MCPALESPDEPRTGVLMDRIHVYICIYLRYDPMFRERSSSVGPVVVVFLSVGNQSDGGVCDPDY